MPPLVCSHAVASRIRLFRCRSVRSFEASELGPASHSFLCIPSRLKGAARRPALVEFHLCFLLRMNWSAHPACRTIRPGAHTPTHW